MGCSHAWCAEDNPESPSPRLHRGDVPVSCIIMGGFFAFKKPGRSRFFFLNISQPLLGLPRSHRFFPLPNSSELGLWGSEKTAEGSAVRIPVPSRIRFENPYPSTKSTKKQKKIISSLLGYFVGLTVCFFFFCLGQIDVWIPFGSLGDPKLQPNFSRLFRGEYIQGI